MFHEDAASPVTMSPGFLHQFTLQRISTPCVWQAYVDITLMGTFDMCGTGDEVRVGLETYLSGGGIIFDNVILRRQLAIAGSWGAWHQRDYEANTDPQICGRWLADDEWRAGQNTTC